MSKRLEADLVDAIRGVLLGMHEDPAYRPQLARGLVERFAAVSAASYDDIRRMLEACEDADFRELR